MAWSCCCSGFACFQLQELIAVWKVALPQHAHPEHHDDDARGMLEAFPGRLDLRLILGIAI